MEEVIRTFGFPGENNESRRKRMEDLDNAATLFSHKEAEEYVADAFGAEAFFPAWDTCQ